MKGESLPATVESGKQNYQKGARRAEGARAVTRKRPFLTKVENYYICGILLLHA
jgi:hypothetical protein